jgi:hypothetical protein
MGDSARTLELEEKTSKENSEGKFENTREWKSKPK